jgi:SAM-dependent methyltransferase
MKDHYKTIPGWFNCPDLYNEMVTKAPKKATFVEIGCWKGKSSSFMAEQIMKSKKDIKFYCVDTWKGTLTEDGHQNDPDVVNDRLFEVFNLNLAPFVGYYNTIRSTSVEAANQFEDSSLDFIYIDASHEYIDVKNDIAAWFPKLKKGGTIAGDDYNSSQVSRAVRESFGSSIVSPNRFTWIHHTN